MLHHFKNLDHLIELAVKDNLGVVVLIVTMAERVCVKTSIAVHYARGMIIDRCDLQHHLEAVSVAGMSIRRGEECRMMVEIIEEADRDLHTVGRTLDIGREA